MSSTLEASHDAANLVSTAYFEPRWYAAYTSANREKRVADQLATRSVEHFLPLYQSVRRWKDRRVYLQLPLFPGYLFVRMALSDRLRVLRIPGVACLVGFNGMPTPLTNEEINRLQAGLASGVGAEPHPYLTVGRRVRVKEGPLVGMEGILRQKKGQSRLIVSLTLIHRAIAVEVDVADIEAL